jgi:hypothetical protein
VRFAPGGYAVIGGFAPDGPERCSGSPVARRSALDVAAALGPSFVLVGSHAERHQTPGGAEQSFAYALLESWFGKRGVESFSFSLREKSLPRT